MEEMIDLVSREGRLIKSVTGRSSKAVRPHHLRLGYRPNRRAAKNIVGLPLKSIFVMRPVRFGSFLLLLILVSFNAFAQLPSTPDGVKQPRILILLDGSSSMLYKYNDQLIRFGAAGKIVETLIDSIYKVNNQVEFGLRVFGHQHPAQENNCTDTRREVMYSKDNYTQMSLRIASLHPSGVSPIAYALKEAATNDLEDEVRNAYSIILITDGGESCNGDICDVVKTLIDRKIFFKPYILSLVDDAPLRTQYACLGNFLAVPKESDIVPAVSAIVSAYRPLLVLPTMTATKPAEKKPDLTTITIPAWIPEHSSINTLPVVVRQTEKPTTHTPILSTVRKPEPTLPPIKQDPEPAPVVVKPEVKKDTTPVVAATPPIKPQPPIVKPQPPVVKPPVRDTQKTSVAIKEMPRVAPAATKPQPVAENKPKPVSFTTSAEDAAETSVQIFFTDGHGRFYKSTPRMQLTDPKTGAVAKQFFRTTDGTGTPDLQQVPAGTYNLMVQGRSNTLMKNVVILPNKKNKILAIVSNGSLIFRYEGDPKRPINEFNAVVNILFEPGPTVKQACTAELEYIPGNYHIEINTLPVTKANVDIDFGNTSVINIKQPGFVQFLNRNQLGRVTLFYQLGDQFNRFYSFDITGNPDGQKVRLQPGPYEVHWIKEGTGGTELVQRFQVRANAVTEIDLH